MQIGNPDPGEANQYGSGTLQAAQTGFVLCVALETKERWNILEICRALTW
jgi:hypothetical protein